MRKLLFIVLMGLCLASCGNKSNNTVAEKDSYDDIYKTKEGDITYYIAKKDGKVGILDKHKKELTPIKYDGISWISGLKGFNGNLGDYDVLYDRDGTCLMDESRGYSYIELVPTSEEYQSSKVPDDALYFYLVEDAETGLYGVCDKYGNEKIKPLYDYVEYYNRDDSEYGVSSFGVRTDKGLIPLYMYVDEDYNIKKYETPIFEKCYRQTKQYFDGHTYGPEDGYTIIRKYDDRIFVDLNMAIKTSYDDQECYQIGYSDGLSDNYVLFNDNGFVRFCSYDDSKYWYRECKMPNLKGKVKKTNNSSGNNSGVPAYNVNYGDYNGGGAYVPSERTPRRDLCRACRGTGKCPCCDGSGQTQTKLRYDYNQGSYLDWEPCNHCKGSGLCIACKGDGYLDEGVDF